VAPQFLIIGAARSGTTALAGALGRHPRIRISTPKEPHFLALHGTPAAFTGPGDRETINRVAITDERRWRALFKPDPQVVWGEGSVSTLYYGAHSVQAIQQYCPDVRMIVILRRPSARAFSAHQYQTGRGWERESFEAALALEPQRIAEGYHHLWHYRRMGLYGEQLQPFIDAFGHDRLLVLDHAEFDSDPRAVLLRCVQFLGLDTEGFDPIAPRTNEGAVRPSGLVAIERALRRSRVIARVMRFVMPRGARDAVRSIGRRTGEIAAETAAELDAYYADDTALLGRLLGDDAPAWARGQVPEASA